MECWQSIQEEVKNGLWVNDDRKKPVLERLKMQVH
jgi:hypothetical protein